MSHPGALASLIVQSVVGKSIGLVCRDMDRPDRRSPEAREWRKLYATTRWKKSRLQFLGAHPLCEPCEKRKRLTPATVVNHRKPHKGDEALFWDEGNWQATCAPCHNGPIKSAEMSGRDYDSAVGVDGFPVDPRHPFLRKI